jgi:predicted nucleotidyltransferase component of viral defense system
MHTAGDPVEYVQFDVQYDAVLGQKNTTDLDITFDEQLVYPIVDHDYAYEDVPAFSLPAYRIEEIFVEKLRSLFQRARARDYYDIYRLLEQESFDDTEIVTALREKARAHDMEIALAQGVPEGDLEAVRAYWEQALNRLVTEELAFDMMLDRIDAYLQQLGSVPE